MRKDSDGCYSPVFFLTGSVNDINKGDFLIDDTLLSVRGFFFPMRNVIGIRSPIRECRHTFDARVVIFHKVALEELDRQS
jgi:hypothetical protein